MPAPRLAALLVLPSLIVSGVVSGEVLWRDPGTISELNLTTAPWDSGQPPKAPLQFVKEEKSGTSPKVIVKDANGETWFVKFGFEAKPETFSTRIVRAVGYYAPATYFISDGTIENVPNNLGRAKQEIDKASGHFQNARFSRKFESVPGKWSFDNADLKGTNQLGGLRLLIMLLSNWDVKYPNFSLVRGPGGEVMYAITDWGETLGQSDEKVRWDCQKYRKETAHWTDGVHDGYVVMNYNGKMHDVVTNNIRVEDLKWFVGRIEALSDAQIRNALKAAGASDEETTCFAGALEERIKVLKDMSQGSVTSRTVTTTTTTTPTPGAEK